MRLNRVPSLFVLLGLLVVLAGQPAVSQQKKDDKKDDKKKDDTLTAAASIFPLGAKAGTTVPVVIAGERLTGPSGFWCEHPGITLKLKLEGANDQKVEGDLAVAANVPPGLYEWRLLAERGASPPRFLAVSSGESQVEKEPNDNTDQAQPLPVEGAIHGSLEKYQDADFSKITGKNGERLLILAQGQALGVPTDLAIAVVDRQGKAVALGKDFLQGDPYIDFTFPADGEFFVQVWNLAPGDQPGRVYRLTATRLPLLQYVFPSGGQRSKAGSFLVGALDPANKLGGKQDGPYHELQVPFTIPADAANPLSFRVPGKASINALLLAAGAHSETNEMEPNNDAKSANELSVPITVNGRFPTRGDVDFFRFKGTKGQKLVMDVEAAALGNKGDLIVTVYDEGGKQLAENNDRSPDELDPRLEFTVPEDGNYVVRVQDVVPQRCIGPKYIYRMTIRNPLPDFRLTTPSPTVFMKPGDGAVVVDVERTEGFEGDIAVSINGLPGDIKAEPATVTKGQKQAAIKVTAPAGVNGKHFPITIVGTAEDGERKLSHQAIARVPLARSAITTNQLFLSVNDKFSTPVVPTPPADTTTKSGGPTVIPAGAPGWKYIAAKSVKGNDWIQPNFKDDSWKTAKAPIGYGEDAVKDKKGTNLELTGQNVYFRREFMVDPKLVEPKAAFKLLVASDNSAVVWINGKMVDNDNDDHEPTYWNRMVDVPANVIVPGKNVIAVQLNNNANSSDAFLDVQLDGPPPKK